MIKNFKNTESLYGVPAYYFEKMSYFEAVEQKIELAKKRIDQINSQIDYKMPGAEYRSLNRQINECQKALRFNEYLLSEYKLHCKNKHKKEQ